MIRIIVRTVDIGSAINVGGPVDTKFKTFDVSLPELEEYLERRSQYESKEVIGVDVVGK